MSPDFSMRSAQKEMLDEQIILSFLLEKNLNEIDLVNRWLGGHQVTLSGVKKLLEGKKENIHIVDIGCGSGGTLKYLAAWAGKNNFSFQFTGIDFNAEAVRLAEKNCRGFSNIRFIHSDYKDVLFNKNFHADIILSCLFCHHLNNEELKIYMKETVGRSHLGVVINDLQRHPVPYLFTKMLGALFPLSILFKNDAPLSVLRAFKKRELHTLVEEAVIPNARVHWKWAFRYLLILKNK